jgi:hypothetical protein
MPTRKYRRKNRRWSGGSNQQYLQQASEKLTQPQVEKLVAKFPEKYTIDVVDAGSTIKKINTDTPVSEIPLEDMNAIKEEGMNAIKEGDMNAIKEEGMNAVKTESQGGGRRRRRSRKTRKTRRSRRKN